MDSNSSRFASWKTGEEGVGGLNSFNSTVLPSAAASEEAEDHLCVSLLAMAHTIKHQAAHIKGGLGPSENKEMIKAKAVLQEALAILEKHDDVDRPSSFSSSSFSSSLSRVLLNPDIFPAIIQYLLPAAHGRPEVAALAPLSSVSKDWRDVIRASNKLWAPIVASILPLTALNDGIIVQRHTRGRGKCQRVKEATLLI